MTWRFKGTCLADLTSNAALQKHYATLQAIALERDVVDDLEDHTIPDVEGMLQVRAHRPQT